jgi:hydroxymethylglutaryl-CoA reductase (NADPH)
MATDFDRLKDYLNYLVEVHDEADWKTRLRPKAGELPPSLPRGLDEDAVDARWQILNRAAGTREALADPAGLPATELYHRNIENFIGAVKVPVGVAGPLRVNGMFAQGDYYFPLATTEATLVASFNRGARVISESGGCTTVLANEGVARAPGFVFENLTDAALFVMWAMHQEKKLKHIAQQTTRHGRLISTSFNIEGNTVYFLFEFVTADASGQNMSTIAANAVYEFMRTKSPIQPKFSFVESNLSGDKKANVHALQSVRGRKVTAEVIIPAGIVESNLHTTPETMARYTQLATTASLLNGTIGTQGHYANGLAALYVACGQDIACVAESAVGITRMELASGGALRVCVTMPNLMVATLGGGTTLPSQAACLDIMGLQGAGKAHAFAEVVAAVCMAGEISLVGSICAHEFVQAHQRFARGTPEGSDTQSS